MGGGGCRGVFTWSALAFPFVTPDRGFNYAPFISGDTELLRHKEMELSKFWKEN